MNFRKGNSLDMAGQGAGLIKGQVRSRMERIAQQEQPLVEQVDGSEQRSFRKRWHKE